MMNRPLALLLLLVGCPASPEIPDPLSCLDPSHLDEAVCIDNPECYPKYASPCDGSERVFLGCLPLESDCAETVGYCEPAAGSGGCVEVSSACFPTGWCPEGWAPCGGDAMNPPASASCD